MIENTVAEMLEVDLERIQAQLPRIRMRRATPKTIESRGAPPAEVNVTRVTGFGPLPRITTTFGEVHAHVLRKGDRVRTLQGQFAPVASVDHLGLEADFVSRYPNVQPIRIRRNAFGPGLPANDILLAPYQRIRPGPPRRMDPFVPAASLLGRPFVERATESQVTYTRFSIGMPAVVYCEGLATELDG